MILLAQRGKSSPEIVDVTCYGRDWVFKIIQRYNEKGPEGLGDGRARNSAVPLLDDEALYELGEALEGPPAEGGLWSGPKVARWISARVGRPVSPQRGWDYLQRLGFSLKVPRPRHAKADDDEQDAFKKGASQTPSSRSNETTPTREWRPGRKTKRAWG